MYNRNQVAAMQPEQLILALNDAEKCLEQLEELNQEKNDRVRRKDLLIEKRDDLQRNGTKIPKPVIIGLVIGFFCCGQLPGLLQWAIIILVIVAIVKYKKHRKVYVAEEVERIDNELIPEANLEIEKSDQKIANIRSWVVNVKSLMMSDKMMNLDYVRGIRDQLERGARNWFEAVQAYEAAVKQKEKDEAERQHRQYMEEQARITAVNSEIAAHEAMEATKLQREQAKEEQERREKEERERRYQEAQRRKNACPICGSDFVIAYGRDSWGDPCKFQQCPNCGTRGMDLSW